MAAVISTGGYRIFVRLQAEPTEMWYEIGSSGQVKIRLLEETPVRVPWVGPRLEESLVIAAKVRSYLQRQ